MVDRGNSVYKVSRNSNHVSDLKKDSVDLAYNYWELNALDKDYLRHIKEIPKYTCTSCDRFIFKDQMFKCKVRFDVYRISCDDIVCGFCYRAFQKNKLPYRSLRFNGLYAGEVPRELQGLSLIEKRMISKINVFFTLIILPCYPVGQYAQKGFAIHFMNDLSQLITQLPILLGETGVACFHSSTDANLKHLPFRKQKVINALNWLADNNYLYRNLSSLDKIKIDNSNNTAYSTEITEYGIIHTDYPGAEVPILQSTNEVQITPTKSDKPINFLYLDHAEEYAFPWLFPYGRAGFDGHRNTKLTLNQYYKTRLYSTDGRWRKDIAYLMHATNILEKNTLSQLIAVYMRIHKGSTISSPMFTAGDLQSNINNTVLRENSYMFLKKIRGTAAYWKNTLLNLLAMIRNIGPPTIFMTLSANDYHWPELAMTIQMCDEKDIKMSDLPNFVKDDPLMSAFHFERRWRALFRYLLKGPQKPLGEIMDYFLLVEFQATGSPHLHIFVWIKDAPSLSNTRDQSEISKFIDNIICTQIPDDKVNPDMHKLVTTLQMHSHRKYCQRRGKCRFNFPYKQCESTRLILELDVGISKNKRFYETKRSEKDT